MSASCQPACLLPALPCPAPVAQFSPHAVDASVFGVLDQMAVRFMNPQLADLLERHPNLVRSCEEAGGLGGVEAGWGQGGCAGLGAAAHRAACSHHFASRAHARCCRPPGCRWRTGAASGSSTLGGTTSGRWPGWMAAAAAASLAASRQRVHPPQQWTRQQHLRHRGQKALARQPGGARCWSRRSETAEGGRAGTGAEAHLPPGRALAPPVKTRAPHKVMCWRCWLSFLPVTRSSLGPDQWGRQ